MGILKMKYFKRQRTEIIARSSKNPFFEVSIFNRFYQFEILLLTNIIHKDAIQFFNGPHSFCFE